MMDVLLAAIAQFSSQQWFLELTDSLTTNHVKHEVDGPGLQADSKYPQVCNFQSCLC